MPIIAPDTFNFSPETVFPGGVELPNRDTETVNSPVPETSVAWLRQEEGVVPGSLGLPSAFLQGYSDHPSHRNGLMIAEGISPNALNLGFLSAAGAQSPDYGSTGATIKTPGVGQMSAAILQSLNPFGLAINPTDDMSAGGGSSFLFQSGVKFYGIWGLGGGYGNVNNVSLGTLNNGAGNFMQLTITPVRPVWVIVYAKTLWQSPDAIWSSVQWGLDFTPTTFDGSNNGGTYDGDSGGFDQSLTANMVHAQAAPNGGGVMHIGALAPYVTYTVALKAVFSSNNNQQYSQHYKYLQLIALTIPRQN